MARHEELSHAEEKESKEQEAQNGENGNVCLEGGDEEDEREETPENEEDAQREAVGAVVALVRRLDAELGDEEHGKGEPECAVGAVNSCAKGVTDAELHEACE